MVRKMAKYVFVLGTGFHRKIIHVNGMPREKYMPANHVLQARTDEDAVLEKTIEIINR